MAAALILTALGLGVVLGLLYSCSALALVTPLFWALCLAFLLSAHWTAWHAFFGAVCLASLLQATYLASVKLRLKWTVRLGAGSQPDKVPETRLRMQLFPQHPHPNTGFFNWLKKSLKVQ